MAENSGLAVTETDIMALQEALCARQQLLQQLTADLDAERESSATAASEALSMILRLQGEKASLRMEASQYKRVAEEKMCYAEEALEVFEDLVYQREMEIASLEFQVQAFKYRLLSMGCNDLGVCEDNFPEDMPMKRQDSLSGAKVLNSHVGRLNFLPQIQGKYSNLKKSTGALDSSIDENEIQEVNDLEKNSGSYGVGNNSSYLQQIKELEELIEDVSDYKDLGRYKATLSRGGTRSPPLYSQASFGNVSDSMRGENDDYGHSYQFKNLEYSQEKEVTVSATCSPGVQDIFEVPQTTKNCISSEAPKKGCQILTMESQNKLGDVNLTLDESFDSTKEAKTDCLRTMVLSPCRERRPQKPGDGVSVDCNVSVACSELRTIATQTDFEQLNRRIERLERARNVRQEITVVGEDKLKLLEEINQQLRVIQSEMKTLKAETSLLPDRPTLDPIQEAMIYFWV